MPTHIVVVGNVTEDRTPAGLVPGGPALYAGRTARALGWRVTLVGHLPPALDPVATRGLGRRTAAATKQLQYENRYDPHGARSQVLHGEGDSIEPGAFARLRVQPDALLLAPAFHELKGWPALTAGVFAIALQGLLRVAGPGGLVRPVPEPWPSVAPFAREGGLYFLSDEDLVDPDAVARQISGFGAVAVVTRGPRGATLFEGAGERHYEALPGRLVDATGAGDCFAAAFVIRYAESRSLPAAMAFGLAAGALSIQAPGLAGVPRRAEIERLLSRSAA